ncbi:hypothetical protein HDU76_001619 [Blyttiomyces sp. JEL0837]|nr:hypothetical protein HDU76_001619 [Blyttiomyces sp. JEL0837]
MSLYHRPDFLPCRPSAPRPQTADPQYRITDTLRHLSPKALEIIKKIEGSRLSISKQQCQRRHSDGSMNQTGLSTDDLFDTIIFKQLMTQEPCECTDADVVTPRFAVDARTTSGAVDRFLRWQEKDLHLSGSSDHSDEKTLNFDTETYKFCNEGDGLWETLNLTPELVPSDPTTCDSINAKFQHISVKENNGYEEEEADHETSQRLQNHSYEGSSTCSDDDMFDTVTLSTSVVSVKGGSMEDDLAKLNPGMPAQQEKTLVDIHIPDYVDDPSQHHCADSIHTVCSSSKSSESSCISSSSESNESSISIRLTSTTTMVHTPTIYEDDTSTTSGDDSDSDVSTDAKMKRHDTCECLAKLNLPRFPPAQNYRHTSAFNEATDKWLHSVANIAAPVPLMNVSHIAWWINSPSHKDSSTAITPACVVPRRVAGQTEKHQPLVL